MASPRVKVEPPADTPLLQMVADMLKVRSELRPSLDVVLNSELAEADKMVAMELFRDALDDPWSPMRNPRNAVSAAAAAAAGA